MGWRLSSPQKDYVELLRALAGFGELRLVEVQLREARARFPMNAQTVAACRATLAKGAVRFLARSGAADDDLRIAGTGDAATFHVGSAWAGHLLPPVRFSSRSLQLVSALHEMDVCRGSCPAPATALASGDRLLLVWTVAALSCLRLPTEGLRAWIDACPLACLAFGFAEQGEYDDDDLFLIGLLQRRLRSDLVARVRAGQPGDVGPIAKLVRLCLARARPDLLGFLVDAAADLFPVGIPPARAAERIAPTDGGSARHRQESCRRAAGFLAPFVALGRHHQRCRRIGFVDDGYDLAQAVLRRWERMGSAGFERVEAVVGELAALVPPTGASP